MENLAFALILISGFAYSAPNYLGNSQEGYAISAEKAAELAKPHLYEAYKLRVTNVADSEEEFWTRGYPIHVTLKNDYYYVVVSLRKKFYFQYMEHAVRIHKITGLAEPPN